MRVLIVSTGNIHKCSNTPAVAPANIAFQYPICSIPTSNSSTCVREREIGEEEEEEEEEEGEEERERELLNERPT